MNKLQLGQSDLHVTPICLGTMTFGQQVNEADAHAILDCSIEAGINFIDTAEMYAVPATADTCGLTETYIGNWFAKTLVRAKNWCWPPRWRAPRAACPGFARARV
jgi:aryl-alcohol dehydrogenase-like predicted oxidoreductase